MKMTNGWNRFVYRLWAPVYDATVGRLFEPGRQRAMDLLAPRAGERVLLLGVGTGADLELLPAGVYALGIDLSPAMLARARRRLPRYRATVCLVQGDAQSLLVAASSFDAAVLNLVLSVVPDGGACLQTALWALKPGGRAMVLDKFQPDSVAPSRLRLLLNFFSTVFGTDITRRFADMRQDTDCEIVVDEPGLLGGSYRIIGLRKPECKHLESAESPHALAAPGGNVADR